MKLSAKFKKILSSGFRATLINFVISLRYPVDLNSQNIIFLNLAKSFILTMWSSNHLSSIKKGGITAEFIFEINYEQLNPKYRVFLLGFPIAKVTYYITVMITSCLEMISVSYGTITLLLCDTLL